VPPVENALVTHPVTQVHAQEVYECDWGGTEFSSAVDATRDLSLSHYRTLLAAPQLNRKEVE
jgi:hypothetical protein